MRTIIATALSLLLSVAAVAQTAPRELAFKIAGAAVEGFARPQQGPKGRYEKALVLRLEAVRAEWESLPPAVETYLYIGAHELRPIATELSSTTVVITFHDPEWEELKGGEVMVLTTEHGDPIANPKKYDGYPRFDPRIIK